MSRALSYQCDTVGDVTNKISLPLADRTFERRQGCWNCKHFATVDASLQHWIASERPAHEARIAEGKRKVLEGAVADVAAITRARGTGVNDPCPCGSRQKYKRCHRDRDAAAVRLFRQIEGIEQATAHVERFEASIKHGDPILGQMALCTERTSTKYGTYVSDRFLCDRWSGATGASVAREGGRLDDLPEELRDKLGDDA